MGGANTVSLCDGKRSKICILWYGCGKFRCKHVCACVQAHISVHVETKNNPAYFTETEPHSLWVLETTK